MPAKFAFIEQYRAMAKDLESQACGDFLNFDQEVPQNRHFLGDVDIKPEILHEPVNNHSGIYKECIANKGINTTNINSIKNYPSFLDNSTHHVYSLDTGMAQNHTSSLPTTVPSTTATVLSSVSSVFVSCASSVTPLVTPHSLGPSFPTTMSVMSNATSTFTSTKTSTFVTELAGSGCTVVSSTDILLSPTNIIPAFEVTDDHLEYTDLDRPLDLLSDEYSHFSNMSQQGATTDEESNSVPLEYVSLMTDTVKHDCDNLKVPYDPMEWSCQHVERWVSWVCQRNQMQDISAHFCHHNGRSLCSLTRDYLSHTFGEAGIKVSEELELLNAANNCFPCQISEEFFNSPLLYESLMENNKNLGLYSCISPAPSSSSSTHDCSSSTVSTHSDPSDDEIDYGSQISSYAIISKTEEVAADHNRTVAKATAGRGHKQTIYLWQFLKELLLSKDNNYSDCIRWLDRKAGVFKIEDSKKVANLWGARKNRPAMNYDKLSRSVRQYYKKGIIKKTEQTKRLIYQFCPGYM